MLSATVRCGNSAKFWNTMAIGRRYGGTRSSTRPSSLTCPLVGCLKPATMRRVVVVPPLDGPSSVMNSPGWTSRSMLSWTDKGMSAMMCRIRLNGTSRRFAGRRRGTRARYRIGLSTGRALWCYGE
jgi:hypothetical protein